MRYIKQFESFFDETELKKLNQHLINVIKKFGYENAGFLDSGWETVFDNNSGVIFKIKLKINNFTNRVFIELVVNAALIDTFAQNLIKYLTQIKGIKFVREDKGVGTNWVYFNILDKDVDKIIKQITKDDLEKFISSNKFNI
jgi:hypothetical protein